MTLRREYKDEVINVEEGVKLLGDRDVYFSIVDEFMKLTDPMLVEIERAWRVGDMKLLMFKAHNIKGASGNLAMHKLYHVSSDLETAAREQRLDAIPELMASAKNEFSRVKEHLLQLRA